MPNNDPFSPNDKKNQPRIKQTPEERANQPPKTLLKERVRVIDGVKTVIDTEAYAEKEDGRWVRQFQTNNQKASDGRWLPIDDFEATSWTGLEIPRDSLGACLNPFEFHEYRPVYLDIDGSVTERGNVLCTECLKFQKRRLFWRKILLLGAIYNPEEF